MSGMEFIKMHGLGNDFVVIDGRRRAVQLSAAQVMAVAARHTGIGCDQVIVMETPTRSAADVFMRIHNSDGGEVSACGNATRCVAALLMTEEPRDRVTIETRAGLLEAHGLADGRVTVDMGAPGLDWRDIPLAAAADTLHLEISAGPVSDGVAVSMGNPHGVFFVDDAEGVALETLGPELEHHALFPERANIGICQVTGPDRLRLRVWERGAGVTLACGTGACAAVVAAHRRGLTGRGVELELDGGVLAVEWRDDDHVLMTGPAAVAFTGSIKDGLLP